MVDEPLNFDLAPEPEASTQPPVAGADDAPAVGASDLPGIAARPLPPLPPIPESRAAAYPFAMQPRFQAHAPRPRVSPRQRLLYGILAAIISIIVVIGIVVALQAFDRAQRG
jgi:hypothetical protein